MSVGYRLFGLSFVPPTFAQLRLATAAVLVDEFNATYRYADSDFVI